MDNDVSEERPLRPAAADGWDDLRVPQAEDEADRWAWLADRREVDPLPDLAGCTVTAVLVTLDAEAWLPETLAGLSRLTHKPTRLIAVDNGSTDNTVELLARAQRRGLLDAVVTGPPRGGFGAGVAAALAAEAESEPTPAGSGLAQDHWLWLLHDDAVPAADSLQQLLAHVVGDPGVDITGPKLVFPRRRHNTGHQISEVGVSIARTGRRDLGLDLGEIDQGQRDQPRQHLGVSTCGMLIRLSDWHALDGLDPDVACFRDGVELGWRATARGLRVVTTPRAEMVHRQVGRAGLRPRGAGGRHPDRVDQQLGLLLITGHAPTWRLPFTWLRLVLDCLLRAAGYLLGKAPRRALDELATLGWLIGNPRRIRAYRRRLRSGRAGDDSRTQKDRAALISSLRPPWWSSVRLGVESLTGTVSDRYRELAGDSEAATLDELTGDDFSTVGDGRSNHPLLAPVVIVGVLLLLASFAAARSLFGLGHLDAPALLPSPDRLGELWASAASPIPGAPGVAPPPWLALMALGSTLLVGQPEWLVSVLLLGVVPLAYLSVYPLLRASVEDRRVRICAAVAYALLPALLGGTNQGRLTLSVVAVLLPLLVLALRGLVLRRPRAPEAWRGGWGAGVVLVGLTAFEPSLILVAAVLGVVGAVWLRRTPRKVGRIGLAIGLPLLVWAPWWPALIAYPGRLFAGPDAALTAAGGAPDVWGLLIGREVGPGLPPLWLGAITFGIIWVAAVVGLSRRPRRAVVVGSWVAAVTGLLGAVVLSRLVVAVPPTGAEIRPWTGSYLLITFGALVLAAAAGIDGLAAELRDRSFGWQQPTSVIAGLLVAVTVLGASGWWIWAGAGGPIERQRLDALPPYLQNAMLSDAGVRVLAIDLRHDGAPAGEAHYSVIFDDQLRLGDADRGFAFGGSTAAPDQVGDLVQRMVAGTADSDITPQLRSLGIGYVWVSGATTEEVARIDNTPALGTASGSEATTVWQLQPAVTRVRVTDGEQTAAVDTLPPEIAPGGGDRRLGLGEAADPRWRASADGVALAPTTDGWQQAFQLPAAGGTVSVHLASPTLWLLIGQGIVLTVGLVLAAPGIRRPEVRDPVRTARRAAFVGGRAQ
ncbi:MAG TPA: glycosyltransferase [Microlunatus sp.]|nr:glycosyltransferase [Microlunatus sp.]